MPALPEERHSIQLHYKRPLRRLDHVITAQMGYEDLVKPCQASPDDRAQVIDECSSRFYAVRFSFDSRSAERKIGMMSSVPLIIVAPPVSRKTNRTFSS